MLGLCFILATERYRAFGLDIAPDLQDFDILLLIVCAHVVSWVCSGHEGS